MRVGTITNTTNLLAELQKLTTQQTRLSQQLATQSKINEASDNPLGFGEISQAQSRSRSMISFRANLERAQLVSDLSKNSLNLLQDSLREAVDAATLLNTSITDQGQMSSYARLLDNLIEQAILAVNTKNGDHSLFAGSAFSTEAFNISRDLDGKAASSVGAISQEIGEAKPTLVKGNHYRIENSNGVDFTQAGAPSNEPGTVFIYDGSSIDWIPGSGAALTAVVGTIKESTKTLLEKGRAYEIVSVGSASEFRDSGATSNQVGTQFVFNGKMPTNWDGAELAALVVDYDNPIHKQVYQAHEFYRVTSGDFTEQAIGGNIITNTFQYNGVPVTDNEDEATRLSRIVEQGNSDDLVVGGMYQIVDSDGTFAGGGSSAGAQTGDVFRYDGTAITDWGSAKLMSISPDTSTVLTAGAPGFMNAGEFYYINGIGGDNFANISTPPNAGTVGTIFEYDGSAVSFGAGQLIPISDTSVDPGNLDATDIGSAFVVVGGNGTLTGGGAGINAKAGTRFIYDGSGFLPSDFGSAVLTKLSDDLVTTPLEENQLYKTAYTNPNGTEVPNLTQGDTLISGKAYRIEAIGSTTDLTGTGASATPSVGEVFTSNGAQPPTWGGLELKPLVLQTAEKISGTQLSEGRTYQIAETAAATTITLYAEQVLSLVDGQTYTISNNGSDADFSTAGGTKAPNVGDYFTANLAGATVNNVDFDGAVLVAVDANGDAITGESITDFASMQDGQRYQVVDNGSALDFTSVGAPNNNTGTTFVYSAGHPSFGSGSISYDIPATDFTAVGAPNNNVGTMFTATGDWPEWGNGGSVYLYRSEYNQENNLTDIGAPDNNVGSSFAYNGHGFSFEDNDKNGTVLFGYKRQELVAEYAGSDTNSEGYYIAEGIKMSPYSEASDNQRFQDVINSMVQLRNAFLKASTADENDPVARFAAQEMLEEAGRMIDDSDDDVAIALGNLEMNDLALNTASEKDTDLYANLGDIVDQRKGINAAEVMTQLNQSYNAYQMALEAGSQVGRTNLFDFI